jgi:hypothetical protein
MQGHCVRNSVRSLCGRFKARYGLRHFIRAMETHGSNGWHPRLHIQVFLDAALESNQLAVVRAWLGHTGSSRGQR